MEKMQASNKAIGEIKNGTFKKCYLDYSREKGYYITRKQSPLTVFLCDGLVPRPVDTEYARLHLIHDKM